ncbi:MAG TPA: hypothetical protein VNQ34_05030 [Xanthobacteraceae bacterium]|jgi:hypothetical protein|nr:hypothetical protein [Xanthobacteraceae bacterium]
MFVLDARKERLVIVLLTVLMAVTRIEHFGLSRVVPDASTAIFFLAGLLISNPLWLMAFLAQACGLDFAAISAVGVDPVCVTFGYIMMIPAYAALWYAPRALRGDFTPGLAGFGKLALACVAGLGVFFVLSNIGYYFGGGFSTSMGAAEFARRVARYFPYYLTSTLIYSAIGVLLALGSAYLVSHRSAAAR